MRIKRIYPKITWQELEALELLIKLFNDIECTGLGISYEKIMVQSNKVNDKFENKIAELILLKKILKIFADYLKNENVEEKYLELFIEYVVFDKKLKDLQDKYDVKKPQEYIKAFTQILTIIINNLTLK